MGWIGSNQVGSSKFDLFVGRVRLGSNPVGQGWVGSNFRWVGSGAGDDQFSDLRDNVASSQIEHPLPESMSCEEERARHKALRVPSSTKNPLQFWSDNAATYPILSRIQPVAFLAFQLVQRSRKKTFRQWAIP